MRTIHKYVLPDPGSTSMMMLPMGGRGREGGVQPVDDKLRLMLWADVDTDAKMQTVTMATYGTGWEVPRDAEHVVTVVDSAGYVWHTYVLPDTHRN